jgi:hypothetical protein
MYPNLTDTHFYVFKKARLSLGVEVVLRDYVRDLQPLNDIYISRDMFLQTKLEEIVTGSSIQLDGYVLPQGTWLAVSILGDAQIIDFEDPGTWVAWDAYPFILGSPWGGQRGSSGTGTCD